MVRNSDTEPAPKKRWGRKKATDGEKKPGRLKQMIEVFKYTQEMDRSTAPVMIAALLGSIAVGVLLSWWILNSPWYGIFLGLAVGVLIAMLILARRAERAAFARIKGQPGAALAAMQSIRRGWDVSDEPVQVDARSQKMVFRAAGRAGVAIVAEDSTSASMKLMDKERRAVRRVLPQQAIPVHLIVVGDGEDEVPLHKLPAYMTKMKKTLTKDESAQVNLRLNALTRSLRQSVPKGVDPMRARPNRKAMRGR